MYVKWVGHDVILSHNRSDLTIKSGIRRKERISQFFFHRGVVEAPFRMLVSRMWEQTWTYCWSGRTNDLRRSCTILLHVIFLVHCVLVGKLLYRVPLHSDSIFMKSFNTCSIDFIKNISQLYPLSKDEKISLKLIEALNRLNPTVVKKVSFPMCMFPLTHN